MDYRLGSRSFRATKHEPLQLLHCFFLCSWRRQKTICLSHDHTFQCCLNLNCHHCRLLHTECHQSLRHRGYCGGCSLVPGTSKSQQPVHNVPLCSDKMPHHFHLFSNIHCSQTIFKCHYKAILVLFVFTIFKATCRMLTMYIDTKVTVQEKSLHKSQVAHQAEANSGFCSMKQSRVFLYLFPPA